MRIEPNPEIGHAYFYLCLASPWVQAQLKARATGSVIDALEPEEISDVWIPYLPKPERLALDQKAQRAWKLISESISLTEAVATRFEKALYSA